MTVEIFSCDGPVKSALPSRAFIWAAAAPAASRPIGYSEIWKRNQIGLNVNPMEGPTVAVAESKYVHGRQHVEYPGPMSYILKTTNGQPPSPA